MYLKSLEQYGWLSTIHNYNEIEASKDDRIKIKLKNEPC